MERAESTSDLDVAHMHQQNVITVLFSICVYVCVMVYEQSIRTFIFCDLSSFLSFSHILSLSLIHLHSPSLLLKHTHTHTHSFTYNHTHTPLSLSPVLSPRKRTHTHELCLYLYIFITTTALFIILIFYPSFHSL